MLDQTIQPQTISQIAVKLASIQVSEFEFPTPEQIANIFNEYLTITGQSFEALQDANFIPRLINSENGDTAHPGITLRAHLPDEDPEEVICAAIRILIPNFVRQIQPPYTLKQFSKDSTLPATTISQIAVKLSSIFFNNLELTKNNVAAVINEYLSTMGQDARVLDADFIQHLINADDGTNKQTSMKGHLSENPEKLAPEELVREAIEILTPHSVLNP